MVCGRPAFKFAEQLKLLITAVQAFHFRCHRSPLVTLNPNGFFEYLNIIFGGFKHEVQHGITIDETPLQAF